MAVYRDGVGSLARYAAMIPRQARPIIILAVICFFLLTTFHSRPPRVIYKATNYASNKWQGKATGQYWDRKGQKTAFFRTSSIPGTQWGSEVSKSYWQEYFKVLSDGKPNFEKIRYRDDFKPAWFLPPFKSTDFLTSRQQNLNMSDAETEDLISKHKLVVEQVKELAPRLPYKPGTRGIVYSTDMMVMPFLLVNLRMLRKTGTTLPVEIWIWDRSIHGVEPHGLRICKEIFEPLDATCRFVKDFLPPQPAWPYDTPTSKYQNKFDALLFSSFEHVAILDSDNVPIMPLDEVFTTEPFTNHGLLLWPDYWRNTASPSYYRITGVEEEAPIKRASTESGQIFLNKATHGSMLLLARYYGLYRYHWITLLSQDPVDEGDKETFQRAARALNLPFYQIAEPPDRIGYRCADKQSPVASGQHHPIDDYYLSSLGVRRENQDDMLNDGLAPRTMFVHCNLPKLDPGYLAPSYTEGVFADIQYCDGKTHRMWGPRHLTILKYGWDVEKAVWDQMRFVACRTEDMQTQWFKPDPAISNKTVGDVCTRFTRWYDELMLGDAAEEAAARAGKGEVLRYDESLVPCPYDNDGEYTLGYEKQKKAWGGTHWRWPIAGNALEQKDKG